MLIIPVLDISRGVVVHAKKGAREHYQPVSSVLCKNPDPVIVVTAFLELYPFKIFYIADLDALQGQGNQLPLIRNLALQFGQCEFWIDAGLEMSERSLMLNLENNIKPVLGSENELPRASLAALINHNPDILLSLDFNETGLIENNYLLDDVTLWPKQLIVMMLHRVGLNAGIDYGCLNKILELAKNSDIYSAGGIRDGNDLYQLKSLGVKGVLIATALHNGSITKRELAQFID